MSRKIVNFCVSGGEIFYFFSDDIEHAEEVENGQNLKLKRAFTIDIHPVAIQNSIQLIKFANDFRNIDLFANGFGVIPEESEIYRSMLEISSGLTMIKGGKA